MERQQHWLANQLNLVLFVGSVPIHWPFLPLVGVIRWLMEPVLYSSGCDAFHNLYRVYSNFDFISLCICDQLHIIGTVGVSIVQTYYKSYHGRDIEVYCLIRK